jgi:hypothetical protein
MRTTLTIQSAQSFCVAGEEIDLHDDPEEVAEEVHRTLKRSLYRDVYDALKERLNEDV